MSKLVSVWLCVCTIVHAHSTAGKDAVNQNIIHRVLTTAS